MLISGNLKSEKGTRLFIPLDRESEAKADDDFEFLGSRGDQYKMIGNAVPPKFSKVVAETVSDILNNSDIPLILNTGLFNRELVNQI